MVPGGGVVSSGFCRHRSPNTPKRKFPRPSLRKRGRASHVDNSPTVRGRGMRYGLSFLSSAMPRCDLGQHILALAGSHQKGHHYENSRAVEAGAELEGVQPPSSRTSPFPAGRDKGMGRSGVYLRLPGISILRDPDWGLASRDTRLQRWQLRTDWT